MRKIFTFLFAALMSVGMFAQLATPIISGDEEFTESTTITITCASAGVDIAYSLDGSDPGTGYPYTGPITITETTTVKAQAFNPDGEMSAVAEKTFTKTGGASEGTITVTWNSNTLSSINISDGESFTKDGVTVTSLTGMIAGRDGRWMGNSKDASFKFSTSLGNFTRIEITGDISILGGSGWTQTSPGAVWTGEANETTCGMYFTNVSQIVFTIAESGTTAVENVQTNQVQATKFFRDGMLLIEKNGKLYNATGAEVK